MSRTIRAARLHQHGAPLQVDQVELPEPGQGEVMVELQFGGVNPVDRYTAEGRVAPHAPLPRTLGGEASGTVDGRKVVVAGGGLGSRRDGVWAEAAVVPAQSVLELPDGVELEDAAAMDGCGKLGFFWRILLPLSRPALVTVIVLSVVTSWNNYILPFLVLNDPSHFTLPLGVATYSGVHRADSAGIFAFTALSMVPALLFFMAAEKRIVGGLAGAVKG
jgi:hypothetical protein